MSSQFAMCAPTRIAGVRFAANSRILLGADELDVRSVAPAHFAQVGELRGRPTQVVPHVADDAGPLALAFLGIDQFEISFRAPRGRQQWSERAPKEPADVRSDVDRHDPKHAKQDHEENRLARVAQIILEE